MGINELRAFLRVYDPSAPAAVPQSVPRKSALIIVDVQNDFITGTLANQFEAEARLWGSGHWALGHCIGGIWHWRIGALAHWGTGALGHWALGIGALGIGHWGIEHWTLGIFATHVPWLH